MAFDLDKQLGTNNSLKETYKNSAFYFEIPVPAGEYALGSIPNQTVGDTTIFNNGAYLMYLDIGNNAKLEVSRTTIIESMTTKIQTIKTFTGVSIVSAASASNYSNSYCIVLKSGIKGDVEYTLDNNTNVGTVNVDTSIYNSTDNIVGVSFKKGQYSVNLETGKDTDQKQEKEATTIQIDQPKVKTITKDRVSFYDYYDSYSVTNILEVTKTTRTTEEGKEESTPYDIFKAQKNKDGNVSSPSEPPLAFMDKTNTNQLDLSSDKNISDFLGTYDTEIMETKSQENVAFSFSMQSEILGDIEIDFTPVTSLNKDQNSNRYIINGYAISITAKDSTQGSILIYDVKRNGNSYTITFNGANLEEETLTITIPQSA